MVTITKGHPVDTEKELHDSRMSICKQCKLYTNHPQMGPLCDNEKHLTLDGRILKFPTSNTRSGCGCKLEIKTRLKHEKCILGKW
jgi:hypothetical protein